MKRLCWSTLCLAAMVVPAVAQRPTISVSGGGVGSSPIASQQVSARIPAAGTGRTFEGLATTDYFNVEQSFISPPNPDMAVGPDDMLMVVNRQIFRLPNPNAAGITPATNPNAQKAFFDVWIGETALGHLCPTQPRTAVSCLFENATVRYDQMHGRWLVLFTVTDTGLVLQSTNPPGYQLLQPRKASWVLVVSRFAVLTTRDAVVPPPSSLDTTIFTRPNIPGQATGGLGNTWTMFYGTSVAGPGSDNFGSYTGTQVGNINSLLGIDGALTAAPFNCDVNGLQTDGGTVDSVCYFPTAARLGLDNEAVTIVSPVINANVRTPSQFYNAPTAQPAYAGNRVRVIKKNSIYQNQSTLVAGNQLAAAEATRFAGDYYDLFTSTGAAGTPVTTPARVPFTAIASSNAPPAAGAAVTVTPPAPPNQLSPLFYEPIHLRGRGMATFSNATAGAPSQSYLVGAISTPPGTTLTAGALYVQGIQYITAPPAQFPNNPNQATGIIPFYPVLKTGTNADAGSNLNRQGVPSIVPVDPFTDPALVPQSAARGTAATTPHPVQLFVGDNRPHRVVFREGHLYDARVGGVFNQFTFPGQNSPLNTTVLYDVIQKLSNEAPPLPVIAARWQNTRAYAPMYDTPANVSQVGTISPINMFPYLEKLFVGTTAPALTPDLSGGTDPRYKDVTGATIPVERCVNNQFVPGTGSAPGITNNLAWPSLYDMRCGEDPYDGQQPLRDPATGVIQGVVPFGIRGGGSTDPNDLSLWAYGAYSRRRLSTIPTGQWGTFGANYKLAYQPFDPYGNPNSFYTDISIDPNSPLFRPSALFAQVSRQVGVGPQGSTFGPDVFINRGEMAKLIVLSQMNEAAVDAYLANTPQFGSATTSNFADVPNTDPNFKYIEVMYRRGYTKGCQATNDVVRRYCPTDLVTRGQMAVFVVRAKLNNVFPTVLSGCPTGTPITGCNVAGDNFGLFVTTQNYFTDNPNTVDNPAYPYIQKLAELRVSNGTSLGPLGNGLNGRFGANDPITREQAIVFVIRAFFS